MEYSRAVLSLADKTEMRLITAYTRGVEIAGPAIYPFYAPAVEVRKFFIIFFTLFPAWYAAAKPN